LSADFASVLGVASAGEFAAFARAHLSQRFADRWISLLRPAVVFPWDPDAPEGPALRHGSEPLLPDSLEWPMFDGRIPMSFIAELDCAALAAAGGLDLMPASGHLLCFCVDHRYETGDPHEHWSSRTTPWTAGTVLYLPDGVARRARRTPDGLEALAPEHRPMRTASTPPSVDAAFAERYFGPEAPAMIERHMEAVMRGRKPSESDAYPSWAGDFERGIHELRCFVQDGGHSYKIQRPLELEAARSALRRDSAINPHEQRVLDEAGHWRVLLQDGVDDHGDMIGYWLLREDDLVAGRFERAYFELQRWTGKNPGHPCGKAEIKSDCRLLFATIARCHSPSVDLAAPLSL
jgi:hypothetical protein